MKECGRGVEIGWMDSVFGFGGLSLRGDGNLELLWASGEFSLVCLNEVLR